MGLWNEILRIISKVSSVSKNLSSTQLRTAPFTIQGFSSSKLLSNTEWDNGKKQLTGHILYVCVFPLHHIRSYDFSRVIQLKKKKKTIRYCVSCLQIYILNIYTKYQSTVRLNQSNHLNYGLYKNKSQNCVY